MVSSDSKGMFSDKYTSHTLHTLAKVLCRIPELPLNDLEEVSYVHEICSAWSEVLYAELLNRCLTNQHFSYVAR